MRKRRIKLEEFRSFPIWIWGAAKTGDAFFNTFHTFEKGCSDNLRGVIDSNCEIKRFHSFEVLNPESFFLHGYYQTGDLIVICCTEKVFPTIAEQIEKRITGADYIYYFDMDFVKLLKSVCEYGDDRRMISRCCRADDFEDSLFVSVLKELHMFDEKLRHRKEWEFAYISRVLQSKGLLYEGKRGIGFAVGKEPLASYFASKGVAIRASDLAPTDASALGWLKSGQNANGNINEIFHPEICKEKVFRDRVSYRNIDMNDLPDDELNFDFCWSSCAIEHLGSIELSKSFLMKVLAVLKPGGISVHTTEFNLCSDDNTVAEGSSVIWRKKDLLEIQKWMISNDCKMEISFQRGNQECDKYVDTPPHFTKSPYHLCLMQDGYITTSFAIIIEKGH